MTYLLDTHVWLWQLQGTGKLGLKVRELLAGGDQELWLSSISIWEILILSEKKKIRLADDPITWIYKALRLSPVKEVSVSIEIAIKSRGIPLPHQDPADRFLAATALVHDLILLTCDEMLLECKAIQTRDARD